MYVCMFSLQNSIHENGVNHLKYTMTNLISLDYNSMEVSHCRVQT